LSNIGQFYDLTKLTNCYFDYVHVDADVIGKISRIWYNQLNMLQPTLP